MALLKLGSIYTVKDGALLVTPESADKFLQKELGWSLLSAQETSLGVAVTTPATWLGTRKTNVDALIKDQVAKVYFALFRFSCKLSKWKCDFFGQCGPTYLLFLLYTIFLCLMIS